jgi:hypothetical protein
VSAKKSKSGDKKPGWLWTFFAGKYGYNANVFFEVISANHKAKTVYKKMVAALKKKGINI